MTAAFTIRVDEETLKTLDDLAQKTERSRNWLVNDALKNYVALQSWQIDKIMQGLEDAKAGRFATEEDWNTFEAEMQARIDAVPEPV